MYRRIKRGERDRRIARMRRVARAASEDSQVLVQSFDRRAAAAARLVTGDVLAEVPTADALAKVAAQRRHVANLRRADRVASGGEGGERALHARVRGDVGHQRQRAECRAGSRGAYRGTVPNCLEVDDGSRRDEPVAHQGDQVRAARDEHVAAPHLAADVGEPCHLVVLETLHGTPRRLPVYASRLCVDRGAR